MSAMQERGRDWWRSYFRVHFPEVKDTDDAVDEILSFASEREAKARREAVELCIATAKRYCPKAGGHTEKGWCTDCGLMIEQLEALLPSPATVKCESIFDHRFDHEGKCVKCQHDRKPPPQDQGCGR